MAINPFELIKNFKSIQSKIAETQEKLEAITAEGSAGGGLVKIILNGKMEMIDIDISSEIIYQEEKTTIQDLVRAAHNDASLKIKEKMREELTSLTGGIDLPLGMWGA